MRAKPHPQTGKPEAIFWLVLDQVEYTTFRNGEGEPVSADVASSGRGVYTPERIPESEVGNAAT
jgi:hypothetical protein